MKYRIMSPSYQNPQSFGTTPNSWLNPFITMSFCMLFYCLENSPPNFLPLFKSHPFIWRTFLIQYLCSRDRQVDPRSSLASQSSLLDKLQTSEKHKHAWSCSHIWKAVLHSPLLQCYTKRTY